MNATVADQYNAPIEIFEKAVEIVDEARENISLACRVTVASVFLFQLLQYLNRCFFMPQNTIQHIIVDSLNNASPASFPAALSSSPGPARPRPPPPRTGGAGISRHQAESSALRALSPQREPLRSASSAAVGIAVFPNPAGHGVHLAAV